MTTEFIHLTIDGMTVKVPKGTTVYTAIKQLGIGVPIFCYHDRMPPFGACRVCLVEVEKMSKLQTSCTLQVTEGMVVKTQSDPAVSGRQEILEFLLLNHPLDCPICDRGGECPLQDQVLEYGPGVSRFAEEKRQFTKPLPLGPVLMLDRERCIICARCTRFGELVAGDNALQLHDRGFRTEVGTPNHEPVESKFIGNTIMICPVGALTSQVYRFRARPWDNQPRESTCTLCPVGCSMILDSRDGEIMRTRSQENKAVNDIWLCDKGWFGYEFVANSERLTQPLIRQSGELRPAGWVEALDLIAKKILEAKPNGKIAAFGGNPLTIEENYLFQKLMRDGCGTNNVDHRIGMPIVEEGIPPGMEIAIGDCEELSFAILLGADITEEFPLLWLRLKAAINKGATVQYFGNYAPEIATQLSDIVLHPPGKEIDIIRQHLESFKTLAGKGKGAFFVGRQYLANHNRSAILSELAKLSFPINILEGKGNSMGARIAGMYPTENGLNAMQVMEQAATSGWDYLHIAGTNVATKFPSSVWKEVRNKTNFIVVQDLFLTETAKQADIVLPTLSFLEKEGHFMGIDGHIGKLHPGRKIPNGILSDGEIFLKIAHKLGITLAMDNDLFNRRLQRTGTVKEAINMPSSKLSAVFAPFLFDNGVRMKHDPHLIKLAKEPKIRLNSQEAARLDIYNDDWVRVLANGNAIKGKVKIDDGVSDGTVVLPLGFEQLPVHELGANLLNGCPVEVKKEYQHKFSHAF